MLVLSACATSRTPAEFLEPGGAADPDIRPEVGGLHGAVASDHPLATAAGYEVLRAGGNAVDAAVTMAGVLAVVRPHMNGVGGDAFALFYDGDTRRITALNSSGPAAAAATPELYAFRGMERMPGSGSLSVTVPGAVAAWADALERHGTIALAQALAPAIVFAEEGFMVSSTLAADLEESATSLNEGGQAIYRPGGRPLRAGDVLRNPALARTLKRIAVEGPPAVYGGSIGKSLAQFLENLGSPLRLSDFAAYRPEWTEPISVPFRDRTLYTLPPNSSGMSMLAMMAMAETLPLSERQPNSAELLHELVEIKKLTYVDRVRWIADPRKAFVPVDRLLDPEYLRARAALIPSRASERAPAGFGGDYSGGSADADGNGDTVFLTAVDQWGNAVSWIQSLYSGFGSRLVDPATGVVLHNRGAGFTLEPGHPNQIAPGKRPFHTLMATMVTNRRGEFEVAIGTPGGDVQPQAVTQVLLNMLVFGMSPQQAIESPRFAHSSGVSLSVEDRLSASVREELRELGHDVRPVHGWTAPFGNLSVIQKLANGVLRTGADMRREGAAMAY